MTLTLSSHPDFGTDMVKSVSATADLLSSGNIMLRYTVRGALEELILPEPVASERADLLWQTTCFEAFIGKQDAPGYLELNMSPSSQWAVYAFENYREGMKNCELVSAPRIETSVETDSLELAATLNLSGLHIVEAGELEMALTAVIEEKNGRKSLWALDHPSGNPDFHNRDCFIHKLKAT